MGKHALQDVEGFVSRKDYFFVDPRALVVEEGFNPREDIGFDEEDQDLKKSIIANGVEVPLKVQKIDGRLVIREGHRRHWACLEAIKEGVEIKSIPVILTDRNISPGNALFMALNCNTGRPLMPLEEGRAFERLLRHGFEVKEIAVRVGRSLPFVYDRLKLVNITPEVKTALDKGKITIKDAATAAAKSNGDPDRQNAVLTKSKPTPIRVAWNKKKGQVVTKNNGDVPEVGNLGAYLFNSTMIEKFKELGLDPATIKFSILPKASKTGTEEGKKQEQKQIF